MFFGRRVFNRAQMGTGRYAAGLIGPCSFEHVMKCFSCLFRSLRGLIVNARTTAIAGFLAPVLLASTAHGQAGNAKEGTGLELSGVTSIPVFVETLTPDGLARGLTRELVEARVSSILRKNGLKPFGAFENKKDPAPYCLEASVSVYHNAFHVRISLYRRVFYMDGGTPVESFAQTWSTEEIGTSVSGTQFILG